MHRQKTLKMIPNGSRGAEFGVWKGDFSKLLADRNPSMLYLVDPWLFQPQYEDRWYGGSEAKSQNDMDEIYASVVKSFHDNSNVTILKCTSAQSVTSIEESTLDWVYIDGNHSFDFVLSDLITSRTLLKDDGILVIEDVQDISWIDNLREVTPDEWKPFIEVYDRRHVKERYDDIMFVINGSRQLV